MITPSATLEAVEVLACSYETLAQAAIDTAIDASQAGHFSQAALTKVSQDYDQAMQTASDLRYQASLDLGSRLMASGSLETLTHATDDLAAQLRRLQKVEKVVDGITGAFAALAQLTAAVANPGPLALEAVHGALHALTHALREEGTSEATQDR